MLLIGSFISTNFEYIDRYSLRDELCLVIFKLICFAPFQDKTRLHMYMYIHVHV